MTISTIEVLHTHMQIYVIYDLCVCELQFEADRRAFIITVNSFGTDLSNAERSALYPACGRLHPEGLCLLGAAQDAAQVKDVADRYPVSPSQFR